VRVLLTCVVLELSHSASGCKWVHHLPDALNVDADDLEKNGFHNVYVFDTRPGLDLQMPPDDFDVNALVEVLGRSKMVRC